MIRSFRIFLYGLTILVSLPILFTSFNAYSQCTITNLNASYCIDDADVTLTGGTNYFGSGVTGSTFSPSSAGVGTHQIGTSSGVASAYSIDATGTFNRIVAAGTVLTLGANSESVVALPFTFNFFGTNHNNIRIGSNLYVGFTHPVTTGTNQNLPSTTNPDNIIAAAWDDHDAGGTIQYFVSGTTPNRIFVIDFDAVPRGGGFYTNTTQIQLYETSNIIEIHSTSVGFGTGGNFGTQGIEDATGSTAYVPTGRNNSGWDATNDFVSFVPTSCFDIQDVTIYDTPSVADAGDDIDQCDNSNFIISAETPIIGVGVWSIQSGPGAITNANSPATTITGVTAGDGSVPTVARWTVSNGPCLPSYEDINLRNYIQLVADAGSDQTICEGSSAVIGGAPTATGGDGNYTYLWTPTPDLSDATASNPTATPIADATYTLTVTDGAGCSDVGAVDITITPAPTADAGVTSEVCEDTPYTVSDAAVTNSAGINWTHDGSGSITNETTISPTYTPVAGDAGNTVTLTLTVSGNGSCTDAVDTKAISVMELPTADAGVGGDACDLTFLLGAIPSLGTGTWTQNGGPGSTIFNNANSPNATATADVYGTYVYRWTEVNGTCNDFAEVTVNYYESPTANITAGSGDVCGNVQTVTAVLSTGTGGTWSQVSGPGTIIFGGATALSTTATPDVYGSYVVRWTEDNNGCTDTDEITINYYDSPIADAGVGGDACDLTFLLGAIPSLGTGTWTQNGGPGSTIFNNANSPNATATADVYGTYVYRWTEVNGTCNDFAEVTVNYYESPTANITAGSGDVCGNVQTVTAVLSTGTGGTWSQVSGPGTIIFGGATALSTTATPDVYGSYVVRWTEDNNGCTDTDEITINYYDSPIADAGVGGDACDLTFLLGAIPSLGTGTWTQNGGPGSTIFNNANSPNATATADVYGTYVYRWTEVNGTCNDFAEVTVNYYESPTANITAGSGDVCGNVQTVTAVLSTGTGGTWSQVSGPGTIIFGGATALSTTATPDVYGSYVVRWTEDNNGCTDTDEITINYYDSPIADAGVGGDACDLTFLLGAIPSLGTGTWTQNGGPGSTIFNNANSPNATATADVYGTYVYRWTEVNGTCNDFAEVTVNYYESPTANITAGSGDVCGNVQTVTAVLSTGTGGTWSQVSGPGTIIFGGATALSTTATPDVYGSYVVRWTEDNNGCTDTDEITINYYDSPIADAGVGGDACDLTFLLGAIPSLGTGTWTQNGGPGSTIFNNANSPNATATADVYGTYVYRWTEVNGTCNDFAEVTVNYYESPTANITAGSGDVCGNVQTVTAVLSTGTGGTWSQVSGPGTIIFGGATALSTTATPDVYGSYVVRWTEDNNGCTDTDEITINYYDSPIADAGVGGDACDLTFLLGAIPSLGTGTWTQNGGPGSTIFNNANSPNATATADVYGTYVYRWTEVNGTCNDFAEVTVNYYESPTANITAGSGDVCGNVQTVTAVLSTGTGGTWSQVSGPGTIIFGGATALSTTATPDVYGSYVVRWTEDNNGCTDTDEITINYYDSPIADAGVGGDACDLTFLLGAIPSLGTGTWTQNGGPGSTIFNNANSPNATATADVYGTYVYRWTEVNGTCNDFAEVTVNYYESPTANITAGSGDVCGNVQTVTAVLSTGTGGTWSQVSGPGTIIFGGATALSTTATPDVYGSYVVRWTEDNNGCTDTDEITINYYDSPIADAGVGGDACDLTFLLGAIPSLGTGTWTQNGGPGSTIFNNANSPNATATADVYGTYVYRWTEVNGTCNDFAEVTVNYYESPTANITAGSGDVCGNVQTVTAVLSTGTGGTWSQVSGPGTIIFGGATALSTTATPDVYGSYVVRWTEDNNGCTDTDEITINYYDSPIADAGVGGDACDLTFLLGAIPSLGTGTWTQNGGPGSTIFNNANSPNATATADVYGTYVYRWTEVNGTCNDFAEVTVNYYESPTANITAGSGDVCGNVQTVTAVLSTGTGGTWSQVSGPGTIIFGGATALSTTATPDVYGSYVVRWTEDNNGCTDTDEITINYYDSPIADAGVGGDACDLTFLLGAIPSLGTGTWTQNGGPGSTIFNNANSPNATATADVYGTYVYRWTEVNGTCNDFAEVTVNYYESPTANITAGSGDVCGNVQTVTAVLSTGTGGTWSQVSGPGTIIFGGATALSTTATPDVYGSYVVRWTEDNNGCTDTDEITINYYDSPIADAGVGGDACDLTFLLGAIPSLGTGTWTQNGGPGSTIFNNANSPNATATADVYGTYVYRWTEVNGTCNDFAEVTVNYYESPTANITAGSGDVCGNVQTVTAVLSTGTGGTWSQVSGPGTIIFGGATALSTTATPDVYGSYVVRWTEDNNGCTDTDEITINYYDSPIADAGVGGDACDLTFLLGAIPSLGTGTWTQNGGPGSTIFNNANSPNATATADVYGTYVYRWTEVNGTCNDFAEVTVNYYESPTANITAGSGDVCGNVQTVTAVLSTGTGGTWSQVSGPGTIIFGGATALSTTATPDVYGSYVVRWTEDNNGCTDTDEITINYYDSPTLASVGPNQNQCDNEIFILSGNEAITGTGLWTLESGSASITNPALYNTTITNLAVGTTAVLRWTIGNGSCPSSFADLSITNNNPLVLADAGSDKIVCGSTTLEGNIAGVGSTGTWSILPGSDGLGAIFDINDPTSSFDGTPGESYTLRWTISNGVCTDTFDEVEITFDEDPGMNVINSNPQFCTGGTTDITLEILTGSGPINLLSVDYGGGDVTGGLLTGGESFADQEKILETLFNATDSAQSVVYTFEVDGGTCSAAGGTTATIIVDPTVVQDITNNEPLICEGDGIDIDYSTPTESGSISVIAVYPAGVIGSVNYSALTILGSTPGSLTETLSNTNTTAATVSYTFTATANSCSDVIEVVDVVVNPRPEFTNLPNVATICSGAQLSFTPTSDVSGTIFTWDSGTPTDITGNTNGIGSITNTLINTGDAVQAVTYVVTATGPGTSACVSAGTADYVVTVDPTVVQDITNNEPLICEGDGIDIDYSTPTESGSISVIAVYPAGVTGSINYSALTILGSTPGSLTETLSNTNTTAATVSYTFTATANSCSDVIEVVDVVVNPRPEFTNLPNVATICSGAQLSFTPTSDVSGTIFTWDSGTPTDITGNTNGIGSITNTLINTGDAVQAVTYVVTATGPGTSACVSAGTADYVVTVDPTVVQDITNNEPLICEGDGIDIDYSTPTESGSISVIAVYPAGVTGSINYSALTILGSTPGSLTETLSNTNTTAATVSYTFTATANSCSDVIEVVDVVVNPRPEFTNLPNVATICSGAQLSFTPTSDVSGTIFTWDSGTPTDITGNTNGIGSITNTLINTGDAVQAVTYVVTATGPGTSACVSAGTADYVVTVDPTVVQDITNNEPLICEGDGIDIDYSTPTESGSISVIAVYPAGVTGSINYSALTILGSTPGSLTETLSNTNTTAATVSYTFTATANSCSDVIEVVDVVVNPRPEFTNLPNVATICSGAQLSFTPTSDVSGTIFTWDSGTPTDITGNTNGIGSITNTLINTGDAVQAVTYVVTATGPGTSACVSAGTADYVVTVDPTVVQDITNNEPLICEGDGIDIDYSTPTESGSISVIAVYPAGVTGSINYSALTILGSTPGSLTETLSNTNTTAATVSYTFTATANSCSDVIEVVDVVVNPRPEFTNLPNVATICSGAQLSFTPTSDVSGTIFTWDSGTPTDITGNTNGIGSITNTLINTGDAVQAVTYVVTATGPGTSACVSAGTADYVVTVDPTVVQDITNNEPLICEGDGIDIDYSTPTESGSISVIAVYPAGVTGSINYSALTILGSTPGSLTETLSNTNTTAATVSYTFTTTANSCSDVIEVVDVVVNPRPEFTNLPNVATICSGAQLSFTPTSDVSGTIFTWDSGTPTDITGNTNGIGSITNTLINTGDAVQAVTYVVTATGPGTSVCVSAGTADYVVTVDPTVVQDITNNEPLICEGDGIDIDYSTPTESGSISVIAVYPAGVTGSINYSALTILGSTPGSLTETLSNTNTTAATVSYTFTTTANSCSDVIEVVDVVVNPRPEFTFSNNLPTINSGTSTDILISTLTENGQVTLIDVIKPVEILGNTSVGVSFVDGNVISDLLTSSSNSPETIRYIFRASANGCTNTTDTDTATVVVIPAPEMTLTNNSPTLCPTEATDIDLYSPTANAEIELISVTISPNPAGLTGYSPVTTKWIGTPTDLNATVTDNLVNATDDIQTITYEFRVSASGFTATTSETVMVAVNPLPSMTITNNPANDTINSGTSTDILISTLTENGQVTLIDVIKPVEILGNTSVGVSFVDGNVISDLLTSSSNSPETIRYIFRASANGCTNTTGTDTATVVVNPAPEMTITNNSPTLCPTEATDIDLYSPTANAEIELIGVTISPNPAGLTGYSPVTTKWIGTPTDLNATVTDNLVNATDDIQTITYEFRVSASGFVSPTSETVMVAVNPLPTMTITNNPANDTINSGTSTDILISTLTENSQVTLIDVIKPVEILGNTSIGVSFVDGESITDVLTSSLTSPDSIKYVFRASANGCTNTTGTDTATVVVNPAPEMTITNNSPTLCPTELTDIDLYSPTANAEIELISVTISPNPAGLTGYSPVTTKWIGTPTDLNATVTDNLVNATDDIQTITYEFRVSASGFTATTSETVMVAVNPLPTMTITNNPANDTINSGTSTDILISTLTENGQVTLIDVIKPVEILGNTSVGVSFVDGNVISDLLTSSSNSPETIRYIFRASANGCTNTTDTDTATVVVIPAPEMTLTNNSPTLCPTEATDIDLYSPTANAEIELISVTISPNPAGLTGYSPVTTKWIGTPTDLNATVTDNLVNATDDIQTITYEFRVSASGFTATTSETVMVAVNPLPTMTITNNPANDTINSGTSTDILISTLTENGQVTLIDVIKPVEILGNTSVGVSFVDGNVISDLLTSSSNSPETIRYIFRASANGCTNTTGTDTATVVVNPAPEMTITNNSPTLCPTELTDIDLYSPTANAEIELIGVTISPNPAGLTGYSPVTTKWIGTPTDLNATVTDNLVNATDDIQTITYEFRVSASGFTATTSETVMVAVNPLPTMTITNNPANDTINSGTSTDILISTLTENGQVTLIDVIKPVEILGNTSVGVSFVDGNVISDLLTSSSNSPETIRYIFRASANGCTNTTDTDTATVVVIPAPEMTLTNNSPTLCPTEATDIDLYSPTANAEIELISVTISPNPAGLTGYSPVTTKWIGTPTDLNATVTDNLVNATDDIQTITYEFRVSASGFTATTSETVMVAVNPLPTMTITNNPANDTINSGTSTDILISTLTENGQVTLIDIIKPAEILGNTSIGVSFVDGNVISDLLTSSSNSPETIKYVFRASANGCTNTTDTDTATVVVIPAPEMTLTNNSPTLCPTEATDIDLYSPTANAEIELIGVTISPNPAGLTGYSPVTTKWIGNPTELIANVSDNLNNATDTIQTIVYEFQISASGFTATTNETVSVTVNPLPTMTITNNLASDTIDNGSSTDILINSLTENGQVTLINVLKSDPGLIGNTSIGVSFVDGNTIIDALSNSTNSSQWIKYIFRASANGCINIDDTDTMTIVVNPLPMMSITNNSPVICSSDQIDIIINSTTSNAEIELVGVNITPDVGGITGHTAVNTVWTSLPHSVDDILVNTTSLTQTIEYIFEVQANGFANPTYTSAFVEVRPIPDIAAVAPGICSDNVTDIDIWNPNGVNFTVFNWTAFNTGVVTGESDGTGNKISQQLSNVSSGLDSIVYRIYSTAQSCVGDSIDVVQYVHPRNIANAGSDTIVCQGTPAINIETASTGGSATDITWTIINGNGTLSNANNIIPTYNPSIVPDDEVGTISLQLSAADTSVCPATSDLVSIIINSRPVVDAGSDQAICESDNALLSEAVISGSASTITWQDSTGLGSFSPNANTLNAFFIPHTTQVGTNVKLYITTNDPAGPCIEAIDSLIITINQAPVVDAGIAKTICEADSAHLIDATIGGSATSVAWSGGSGVFYPDNITLNAYYIPAASEIGTSVTLTLTTDDPDAGGPCIQVEDQVSVTINKAPEVDAGTYPPICETSSLNLNGSISGAATSATWSTSGDGTFSFVGNLNASYTPGPTDISNSGVTLTLTTNDPSGPCTEVSDDIFIQIDEAPIVDAGTYAPVCIGDTIFLSGTIGGSATSATWSGGIGTFEDATQLSTYYLPNALEQGSDVIFTLTTDNPANACFAGSDLTLVTVNRLPLVGYSGLNATYQVDDPSIPLTGIPSGGLFSGPGVVVDTFSPVLADTGTHVVRYTYVDGPTGCSNFEDKTTVVVPLPPVEIEDPGPYCLNEGDQQLPKNNKPGFSEYWVGDNVTPVGTEYYFAAGDAKVGTHLVQYIIQDDNTLARDTVPKYIDVRDAPKIDFATANNCIADTIQFLDLSVLDSSHVFNDTIVAWEWEIGIGSEFLRVDQNPRIKFEETKPNDYYIRLTATTEFGCSEAGTGEALIGAVPEPIFNVNNLTFGELSEFEDMTPIPNESEDFPDGYDDPTSSIDSIYWDFGEGSPVFGSYGTHSTEHHQYTVENQEYRAIMRIWTDLGCYAADTISVTIISSISTFPYFNDYESPSENTSAFRGENPSWKLTVPDGAIIKGSNRAWVTSNDDSLRHNDDERSYVALPAFDLSSLLRPMISLDIWSNSENTRDGAVLQYSYTGDDWKTLVDSLENIKIDASKQIGLNWYNETGLVSSPGNGLIRDDNDGTQTTGYNPRGYGWTGVDTDWRTARFPLDSIRDNQPSGGSVRFRVVFSSDQQNPDGTTYDGFAFDNLFIGDREHNVLFEHFDNMDHTANQIDSTNILADRFALDLIPLQYHTNYPSPDAIYLNNKYPVETRGSIYDINQSPRSFMDGITEYDYSGAYVEDYQLINRSLEDPLFDIDVVVTNVSESKDSINVTITARDTLNEQVILNIMPIETGIYSSAAISLPQSIDSLNNVVKDMRPGGGWAYDINWDIGTSETFNTHWDLNELLEDNEIYDNSRLGLIVFVQNNVNEGSREVYQAVFTKLSNLQKTVITGLEEELNIKKIEDANIYPNPAQDYFHVALSDQLTQDLEWTMIDQRGVELMHGTFESGEDNFDVNTRNIPNGLHLFIVTSGNDYKTIRKIIIQR